MNTVTFDIYNSYEDLGLILTAKTIGAPSPKLLTVDIPSGDGELDYSDYFGEVNFNNRTLSFDFSVISDKRDFLKVYSRLQNLLNGRKMKITLSDDPDFYYVGRVTVNDWKSEKNIGKVTIDVNAEPYKLKQAITVIYQTVKGTTIINCRNLRKTVAPKISFTSSGALGRVSLGGKVSNEFSDVCENTVIFGEGDNLLTVIPSKGATLPLAVRIEYREGGL